MIDTWTSFATILLAISLTSERLVAILKTIFPKLADESLNPDTTSNLKEDRPRRLLVQLIAFLSGWLTSSFLCSTFDPLLGTIKIAENVNLHVALVGFLSMGGSSLWSSILGYTKAVKDIRVQEKINLMKNN